MATADKTIPADVTVTSPAAIPALRSPVVGFASLNKALGTTRANTDVSVDIGRGEMLGLIGANGARKSTLVRILSGILLADSGTIAIDGTPVTPAGFSPT